MLPPVLTEAATDDVTRFIGAGVKNVHIQRMHEKSSLDSGQNNDAQSCGSNDK